MKNLDKWLIIVAIFFLESMTTPQLGTYGQAILPNAMLISQGLLPAYFPMWGYEFLVAIPLYLGLDPIMFMLVFQLGLCLVGIRMFYAIFEFEMKWWHIPLFVPYIAVTSGIWLSAIAPTLILSSIYFYKVKNLSSFLCAFSYWFRPEVGLFGVVGLFSSKTRQWSLRVLSILACFVLVWFLISGSFGSTNGGVAFYEFLGQLNGNVWGIQNNDSLGAVIAYQHGHATPWTKEANAMFWGMGWKAVSEHPDEFVRKCLRNFFVQLYSGCYVGNFDYVYNPAWRWLLKTTTKIITGLFMLWVYFRVIVILRFEELEAHEILIIGFLVVQLLIASLFEQGAREVNVSYLPIVGLILKRMK